jgi:hypothetical protein
MPFVDVEDTNLALYPIHLPVACGRDSGDRSGKGQTLTSRGRILRFSLCQNLRVGQRSRPNSHGLRAGMTGPTATFRGLAPSSACLSKPGSASLQRSAMLAACKIAGRNRDPRARSFENNGLEAQSEDLKGGQ